MKCTFAHSQGRAWLFPYTIRIFQSSHSLGRPSSSNEAYVREGMHTAASSLSSARSSRLHTVHVLYASYGRERKWHWGHGETMTSSASIRWRARSYSVCHELTQPMSEVSTSECVRGSSNERKVLSISLKMIECKWRQHSFSGSFPLLVVMRKGFSSFEY